MPLTLEAPRAGSPVAPHDPELPAVDPIVRVQLCGSLRIKRNGEEVTHALPGPKGRALVAFLAARFPEGASRDELIDVVWPTGRPADPRANLRTLLSRTRDALGPGTLTTGTSLRLSNQRVTTDLASARAHVHAAREHRRHRHAHDAVEHARAAVDILDRRVLRGFDDGWVDELWASLDNDILEMLACIADMGSLAGGSLGSAAISAARELTKRDGDCERSHAHLMLALARAGERGEALRAYDAARTHLRRHLGITPGPELRDLHTAVLVGRLGGESFDGRGAPLARASLPARQSRSGPFAGRDAELELVRDPGPAEWGSRVVTVTGGPGTGKTTLLARAIELAAERGQFVVHSSYGAAPRTPYEPFADAVRQIARALPPRMAERLLAPLRHELAAPARRGRGHAPSEVAPTSVAAAGIAVESAATLLRRLAAIAPVLVAIDDAHLASHESCLWLRHLERAMRDLPVTFLIAHREQMLGPSELRREFDATGRGLAVEDVVTDIRRERRITPVVLSAVDASAASRMEDELCEGVA